MKRPSVAVMLLMVGAFLIPLIGGQISADIQPLAPGFSNLVGAFLGGGQLPLMAFAILASFPLAAFAITVWRRKVVPTATMRLVIPLVLLMTIIGMSITVSEFSFISVQTWLVWLGAGSAFYAAVAATGRRDGPRLVLMALVAGVTLTALMGVSEYSSMRSLDPSWRIFANWVNQNALSDMLLFGFFGALGLLISTERVGRILCVGAATVIGCALVLAQSKGGLACGLIGITVLAVLLVAWKQSKSAAWLVAPLLLIGLFVFGLRVQASKANSASAIGRVVNSGSTAEQSVGFRKLLWQGATVLIKQNPVGYGVGTYRFQSARPGLTQQTHLTHNTYLQLAVEASPTATILFLWMAAVWLWEMIKGARKLPAATNQVRAAIVAGGVAFLAHNMIDSGMYYPGLAICFFLWMGLGLQWSADGIGPEMVPKSLRRAGAMSVCAIIVVGLFYFGSVEAIKASTRFAALTGDVQGANAGVESLLGLATGDGEAWYVHANYSQAARDPSVRLNDFIQAVRKAPMLRHYRGLASEYMRENQIASAIQTLEEGLKRDPNNLPTLKQLLEIEIKSNPEEAILVAKRLVAVDDTPYMKIRALPEVIPTETLEARLFLAPLEKEPAKKAALLQTAVEGFAQYARLTLPKIKEGAQSDPPIPFSGETLPEAKIKLGKARNAAKELIEIYRSMGEPGKASSVEELLGVLAVD